MQAASETTAQLLHDNWLRVSEQVAEACHDSGRDPSSVRIVGVSKYVGPELAWQLRQAGCQVLGENRPQSLWEKCDYFNRQVPQAAATEWHLIGHLQRNKLKRTLPMIALLHSLDSLRLAQAISQEMQLTSGTLPVLLEVNITSDKSKTGMSRSELDELIGNLESLPGIAVRGLMAMSSMEGDEQSARHEFEQVQKLRDELQSECGDRLHLTELSMGMSGDYRQAIAAGATLVRIGSKLWQGLE